MGKMTTGPRDNSLQNDTRNSLGISLPESGKRPSVLTSLDVKILTGFSNDKHIAEISEEVGFSEHTVNVIAQSATKKLNRKSLVAAVAHAVRVGIIH